jgi:hypothetical protein
MTRSLISGVLLLISVHAHAAWGPLWSLGTKDADRAPFSGESSAGNTAPTATSATTHDNDYFFAGAYAAPVGAVATSEPPANFEGAMSTWDNVTRIHFQLTPAQASSTAQLRFRLFPIWGGYVGGSSFGTHQLRLRLNGTMVTTWTFTGEDWLRVTFNAAPAALAGANVLELMRTGGTTSAWFGMDALALEVNASALVDADSDGLPQGYEEEHSLNDSFAGDATQDPDLDALTNLQERTRGTDPHDADSDDDGLLDGAEITTNPLVADSDGDTVLDGAEITAGTNPLAIDSDSDGAPDAWELRVGTNAMLGTSTSPAFVASIGVKFSSEVAPSNVMSPYAVTGLMPQMNWNNTQLLNQWSPSAIAGTQAKLVSPLAGVVANSAGAASGATMAWSANATWKSGNSGTSAQELLNAGLWTNSDSAQATVSFANLPFATYDVIVYVGNTYSGGSGYVRLNGLAASDRSFQSWSAAPVAEFVEPVGNSATQPRLGNAIVFRQVTGAAVSVQLFRRNSDEVGIHAIQVVSSTLDGDADGMSDAFEVTHRLNRSANDSAADLDNDGLPNGAEFVRRTDPRRADSDGDGLSDAVETGTGVWVSAANTGSNPLHADSDADGLGDGAEVNAQPRGTNPNLPDSDADGLSDATELAQNTDPTSSVAPQLVPVRSGNTFDWTLYMQVIWDHDHANLTDSEWGERQFFWMEVQNREAHPGQRAMGFSLRTVGGAVTSLFTSSAAGAFSSPGAPGSDLWHADWSATPPDLATGLGFSRYGRVDISDRLRVRVQGSTTGAASAWTLTFSLHNLDTNQTVHTQTFTNCTLVGNVHSGSVTWTDDNDVPNRISQDVRLNTRVQFLPSATSPSIELLPAFASVRDSDNDGMPDVWETLHSFNPSSAADAALDADADGLSNVREYVLGTLPRNADSDGDGARDGLEISSRSNPLAASSKPPFWSGLPIGAVGEDLNGNGLSDAFELAIGRFDLSGAGDADSDGMSNADEAAAGTDPLSALSRLWVGSLRSGADLTVSWPRLLLKSHQLQRSTDFVSWASVSGAPAAVGNEFRQTIPNAFAAPRTFFRARVQDLDSDSDGVSDWAEVNVLGSSTSSGTSLGSNVSPG